MRFDKICIGVLSLLTGVSVSADVIASYGLGTEPRSNGQVPGQAVTTPSGGPWANIEFSWLRNDNGNPFAEGSLYLLSISYAGLPANLGPSTPGLIGIGTVSGGGVGTSYTFDPSVLLQSNTQYFLYSNIRPGGPSTYNFDNSGTYAGGSRYGSLNGTVNFRAFGGTASFILEGTQVPETTTTVSLGVALAVLVGARWVVQRRGKVG